jgi:hypothetical protein
LKALPLPAFFFCPGGQKPGLFAPFLAAVFDRCVAPDVLSRGGVPPFVAELASNPALDPFCWATAPPTPRARNAAATSEMADGVRMIFSAVERLLDFHPCRLNVAEIGLFRTGTMTGHSRAAAGTGSVRLIFA